MDTEAETYDAQAISFEEPPGVRGGRFLRRDRDEAGQRPFAGCGPDGAGVGMAMMPFRSGGAAVRGGRSGGGIRGWVLAGWLAGGAALGAPEIPQSVLVLTTEDSQSRREAAQIEGLRSALPPGTEVIIDYLDVRRISFREHYLEYYESIINGKYRARRPSVIVALNDGALRVVDRYRASVFSRVPLVICGLDLQDAQKYGGERDSWAGVFSAPDPEQAIDVAVALYPAARAVQVWMDYTDSGVRLRNQIAAKAADGRFPVPVSIPGLQESDSQTWGPADVRDYFGALGATNLILHVGYLSDLQGGVYLSRNLIPRLSKDWKAPVFTTQYDAIGEGVVGGNVVNARRMGEIAGEMAGRILAGGKPGDIPPVILPGEWVFDYVQLTRWGIAERSLPKGSRIIHRPHEYLRKNKWLIIGGGAIIGVEAMIIMQLALSRMMRRRAMRALQASEARYRDLFESSQDIYVIVDGGGRVLYANPAMCRWAERDLGKLIGSEHADWIVVRDRDRVRVHLEQAREGTPADFETSLLGQDGKETEVEFVCHAHDFNGQPAVVCCARLLSERIRMERMALEVSERERQALGYDIHDGLGPFASALQIQCHLLKEKADRHEPADGGNVEKLTRIAESLAAEVRTMARSLVPLAMVDRTLASALRGLVDIGQRYFQAHVELEFALDESRLNADTAAQLYRIVQEYLRNAIRHAGANNAWIAVGVADDGEGGLTIENDGQPFEQLPVRRTGLGLSIMEQRARMIGGSLVIRATPEGRTRLTCRFALKARFPCVRGGVGGYGQGMRLR